MQLKTFNDLIAWNTSNKTIAFKTIYVDITNDLIAGLLLSQIMYWFLPNQEGNTKLRVERDGRFWLCKSRSEWYNEIRISEKQYDRASNILLNLKIIDVETFKFGGTPKLHIALNYDVLIGLLNAELKKYSSNSKSLFPKPKPVKVEPKEDKYKIKVNNYLAKQSEEYQEVFEKFQEMRKKIKKPMTHYAKYLMLSELEQYFPSSPEEHIKRFQTSIQHDWQGVIFDNEKAILKNKRDRY